MNASDAKPVLDDVPTAEDVVLRAVTMEMFISIQKLKKEIKSCMKEVESSAPGSITAARNAAYVKAFSEAIPILQRWHDDIDERGVEAVRPYQK